MPPQPVEAQSERAEGGWTRPIFIPPPDLGLPASPRARRPSPPLRSRQPSPRHQREPTRVPPRLCYTRNARATAAIEPSLLEAAVTW